MKKTIVQIVENKSNGEYSIAKVIKSNNDYHTPGEIIEDAQFQFDIFKDIIQYFTPDMQPVNLTI